MFAFVLALHSLLRWVVLILGLMAVSRALTGWFGRRAWAPSDDRRGLRFTIALDVQFLVGLVLHLFLSPVTIGGMADFGAAMQNSVIRYWLVEHPTLMIVALVLVHVGRVRVRKAADSPGRHRAAAIFFTLGLLCLLAGTPWPFSHVPRPLFPWG